MPAAAETKSGHCKMSLVDYSSSSDDDVALPLEQEPIFLITIHTGTATSSTQPVFGLLPFFLKSAFD
ncbi:uncharacterized protein DS421_5g147670 [Arachis hypogaea]|nr:uncharacterized protein DS421_5g147670 [Arachis hypogaea]